MKTTFAIASLLSLAVADWAYTFTGPNGAWTSVCTSEASAWSSAAPTNATVTASSAPASTWTFTTKYEATYSSGTSTWAVPQTVSYSAAGNWTSMIPAPTTSAVSSVSVKASTTVAPSSAAPVAPSSAAPPASTFTGAASSNKMFGGAALAAGALALVL